MICLTSEAVTELSETAFYMLSLNILEYGATSLNMQKPNLWQNSILFDKFNQKKKKKKSFGSKYMQFLGSKWNVPIVHHLSKLFHWVLQDKSQVLSLLPEILIS